MQALRTGFVLASWAVAEAGSGSLLGGLDSFTMLGLMCLGTLPMGGVGFPKLALVKF